MLYGEALRQKDRRSDAPLESESTEGSTLYVSLGSCIEEYLRFRTEVEANSLYFCFLFLGDEINGDTKWE